MSPQTTETERAEALITLTRRLTDMLAVQAAAFEERRPHEVAHMMEESGRLANLYRQESTRLKRNPDLIKGAPEPVRQRLIQATEMFEAVLARHGRALTAMKTITEGLVRAIAAEVTAQRTAGSSGYGATGTIQAPTNAGAAIALNKQA